MIAKSLGYVYTNDDARLSTDAVYLHGIIFTSASSSGTLLLYDGLDTITGRLFAEIRALNNTSHSIMFPKPVLFKKGIYVDRSSSTVVTLLTEPYNESESE